MVRRTVSGAAGLDVATPWMRNLMSDFPATQPVEGMLWPLRDIIYIYRGGKWIPLSEWKVEE